MVSIPQTNEPVQAQAAQQPVPFTVYQRAQAQIHQLQQENRQLRQQLHWHVELNRVSGKIISQGHKGSERAVITHLKDAQPDEAGWYHLDIWRIAQLSGQSAGTVGKHIKYLSKTVHLFDRREVRVPDEGKPNGMRTEIYVKPHFDLIARPGRYQAEKDREHGGDRKSCPNCGSEHIRKKTTHTCMDCGLVIAEKITDFNPDQETDDQDYMQKEGRAESVRDENQLDFARQEINLIEQEQKTLPDQVDLQDEKPPTPPVEAVASLLTPPAILSTRTMKERPQPTEQEAERQLEEAARLLLDIAGDTASHISMPGENGKKYKTVHRPLTLEDMRQHILGTKTVGATLTRNDGTTRALCFDGDDDRTWQTMTTSAQLLIAHGLKPLLEPSPAGRGGHLWLIFSERVNAQAAYGEICGIAPTLTDIAEYWPSGRSNQKVRLPAGQYVTSTFSQRTRLYDAHGDELPVSALLTHQTPAELIPASSDTTEPKPAVFEDHPRNRDVSGVTKAEHRGVDEYHRRKYGKHDMWVEWPNEQYLIDRFNDQHTIDELATRERSGMINASSIGRPERTASVGVTKDGGRFTDFGASARRADGRQDGGDAFEFYIRLHQLNKSDVLRELGKALSKEASQELLRAARSGELPEASVMKIITDKGREVYNQNATRHGHATLEQHRGVGGFSKAGEAVKQETRLPWQVEEQEEEEQGIPEDFTLDTPCEHCGCALYRDMLGSIVCVRCYPPRGYHNYRDLIDEQYPRRKRVEFS